MNIKKEGIVKSIEAIVQSVIFSTKDTIDTFIEETDHCSEEKKNRVLERLSIPFKELSEEYIEKAINQHNSLEFIYADKDFEKADSKIEDSDSMLRRDEVMYKATELWIERKEKELKELLSKYELSTKEKQIKTTNTYPTFTTSSKINIEQLELLFEELNRIDFIKETDSKKFTDCFTKKQLTKQPHINFYNKPIMLWNLFRLMNNYSVILDTEKNKIFNENELFVDKEGNKFKTQLKNGLDSLGDYPKNKSLKEVIIDLEKFFKKTFTQH